jgi:curved DNA-binding protein CbpA
VTAGRPAHPTDLYRLLQVDPEADVEIIGAAYRKLAQRYHPDVADDPDAAARMAAINAAWEVLRDPARRAEYDRSRFATVAGPVTARRSRAACRRTRAVRRVRRSPGHRGQQPTRSTTADSSVGQADPAGAPEPRHERVHRRWRSGAPAAVRHRQDPGRLGRASPGRSGSV